MIQLFSESMLESPGLSFSRHKMQFPPLTPCQNGTSGMLSEWNTYIGKVAHLLSETIANTSQHLRNGRYKSRPIESHQVLARIVGFGAAL